MKIKTLTAILSLSLFWLSSALADNRYVPPFVMRLTNSYYIRITNNEASTKRARCIALITSGSGVGTVAVTDLNISGSGTGDCRPLAGIEWNLQAIVHQGSITVGSYDGTNLINLDTSPATATTEGVYQVDFVNQAAPATPATGITAVYTDATSKVLCGKNDTGAVNCVGGGIVRALSFTIGDPAGSALTSGATTTDYVTIPFACTLNAWNLVIDAGTITVKFWKVATGTAIPTSSNSINTSGVAISTGTAIHSTTMTDFTSTTVSANDIMAMNVTTVATAKYVNAVLECQ